MSVHHIYVFHGDLGERRIHEISVLSDAMPLIWDKHIQRDPTEYDGALYELWLIRQPLTREDVQEVIDIVDASAFADALTR